MPSPDPADELRRLGGEVRRVIADVAGDPAKGSNREREHRAVRATQGGGGFRRAAILEELNAKVQIVGGHHTLVTDGLADVFGAAALRDNTVNTPAASIVVRSALEIAGQIDWLLDPTIDGNERARRALIWRFNDLRQQRTLFEQFAHGGETADVDAGLARIESAILDDAHASKWTAKPTVSGPKDTVHAHMVSEEGKPARMPRYGALVSRVQSTASLYSALSAAAHGTPFGVMLGVQVDGETDEKGSTDITLRGFGVPPKLAFGLGVLSLMVVGRRIADWNGLDASPIVRRSDRMLRLAGLR